jgi:hypothetical protein
MGPRVGLDILEKKNLLPLLGLEPQIVQPIALTYITFYDASNSHA